MPKILIKNPVLGGMADSKYLGIANSLHKIVGFDLHSEPGIIKNQQKLKKDSGTTIDEFVKNTVVCSNGETYLFSSTSGKIWARSAAGAYRLAYTTVPTASGAGCSGAREYNGYVYWATEKYLHRILISEALDVAWTTMDQNWQTFTNGDADFHPTKIVNNVLYIGDKNYIAQVDDGTFSAKANDIVLPYRICSLGQRLTELLYGSFVTANIKMVKGGRWDTWSESYNSEDDVPLPGINCFMPSDNYNLVNAGRKGDLFEYDGTFFVPLAKVPGNWARGNEAVIYPDASAIDSHVLRFGLSAVAGTPGDCGVYGYGSYDRKYPKVLSLDFPISTGNMAAVQIGSVFYIGDDLFVTWKDNTVPATPTYGVDILDTANKCAAAYMDTRVIDSDREIAKDIEVSVNYRSLPANCDIEIWQSVNGAAYSKIAATIDTDNLQVCADVKVAAANAVQFRVISEASVNTAPEIESILIEY